jgi:hypothetical protein
VAVRSHQQRRRRALEVILAKIYSKWLLQRWVKNPNGFGFYLLVKAALQRPDG